MEFPFGHHTHTHHRRQSDDDDYEGRDRSSRTSAYPPPSQPPFGHPPPPYYGGGDEFAPPPPPPSSVYHTSHVPPPSDPYPAPGQQLGYSNYPPYHRPQESEAFCGYPPQQPPSYVHHVSHETETHHSYQPHMPSFGHHHTSQKPSDSFPIEAVGGGLASYFSNKSTVKVYCKAEPNYSLTIRDDKVILAPHDPNDPTQQWYKDEKFSTRVKDEEGFPCFSLVNKATGQAIKHSVGASHPVQLVPYSADQLDSSILWTESRDMGDGYRTVRMVNNIRLNLDAFHGDKHSGGVRDGTTIVLWQWNKGENQLWKISTH